MNWDRILYPLDVLGCNLFGRRFIGAESVDGVLKAGERRIGRGFRVTYNLLGEHVQDEDSVKLAVRTTLNLIAKMIPKNRGNVSCKPTLYGLCISKNLFRDSLSEIVWAARRQRIEIEIDAESYEYIPDTFEVFSYFAQDPILGNSVRQAVQAHLVNIESLMDRYCLWDKKIRIVKGSGVYDEKDSVITTDKSIVLSRYLKILKRNLQNEGRPYVATVRDKKLANEAIAIANSMGVSIVLQTLHGPLGWLFQKNYQGSGQVVSDYMPFTDNWCKNVWKPYGLRRAKMFRHILWETMT